MDSLSEIIKIVNKKRLSKIDVLDKTFLNSKNENLYFKLYNAICNNELKNDDEAGKLLYNTDKKDPRYKMLKSRLKGKMLKSILLFNSEDLFNNDRSQAYYECLTHNQIIEIIIKITGTTKLVYELVMADYSKASEHEFYGILTNYSFYRMNFYSIAGHKKSFLNEEIKYLKYIDLYQKEQFAKYLYYKANANFEGSKSINNKMLSEIKVNLDDLYKIKIEIKNTETDFFYYYLALLFFESNNQLDQILMICDEADTLMNNNSKIVTNTRRVAMLLYRTKALLNMRKYGEGIKVSKSTTDIVIPEGNQNWFLLREFEFKLYLQDKKLKEAYKVYEAVLANKSFKRQGSQMVEKWNIYHAYWVFMDSYLNKGDYKFSLPKFLNDVPVNTKDKSGYNFSIRIVEMLFQMARKDYNLLFSKMDALHVYRSRYLNDNTYKRNHLFLSLLLKSEKIGFMGKDMKKANWEEIKELRKQNNYIIADWEIIPYEELWDIFVDLAK